MTELLIIVSHCTTPLKRDMPALTVRRPALTSTLDALTVTAALAFTVMPEADSITELPLASSTRPSQGCPAA